jgi:hypothetical protein
VGCIFDLYLILQYNTSLVDLSFGLHMVTALPLVVDLLVRLQGMSSLRRLEVNMECALGSPA